MRWQMIAGITGALGLAVASFQVVLMMADGRSDRRGLAPVPSSEPSPAPAFHVTVNGEVGATQPWLIPSSRSRPPGPPRRDDCYHEDRVAWVRDHGGIPFRKFVVNVVVTSSAATSLVVEELQLDTLRRRLPVRGRVVRLCPGGDPIDAEVFVLDLDAGSPHLTYEKEALGSLRHFEVKAGAAEVFTIVAVAKRSYFEWSATLTILHEGQAHVVDVSDGGDPFEVAGKGVPLSGQAR